MKALEHVFTLLHIRTYNMKFLRFCLRKWILITLIVSVFFQFSQMMRFAYAKNPVPETLIDLLYVIILLASSCFLTFHWIKAWRKADYLISLAIHGNPNDDY